jgi:CRISPR-associated protein Csm4
MTVWTTYCLSPKPGAGFHFGLRGLAQEESAPHCPSDTLFAALVATLGDLDGSEAVRAFVTPFREGRPPFLLTSVFPRVGHLPLLPFPFLRVNLKLKPGQRKLFKRLRYVSPVIFRRLLMDEPMAEYADGEKDAGAFLQDGRIWLAAEEIDALPDSWQDLAPEDVRKRNDWRGWLEGEDGRRWLREQKVWGSRPVDRVTVDRISAASAVYRIGRTVYAPGCGLWLGVQWPAGIVDDVQARLGTLLAHLGDRGLGGERSVGYGQFTLEKSPMTLDLPAPRADGPHLTLSRYLPRREELPQALRGRAAYRLDGIAGWLGAPGHQARRRKQVRMLREGSVFEPVGAGPWGRLTDVQPEGWDAYPIWRWGYACPVGVRIEETREVNDD